jgi:hypothetical protein
LGLVGPALVLLLFAIALVAHFRARRADSASVRRSLLAVVAGHLAVLLAMAAVSSPRFAGSHSAVLAFAVGAGVISWFGVTRLLACDAGLGDWIWRGLMALACLASSPTGWEAPVFFAALGILSYRWNRRFDTRQRFGFAVSALALFLIEFFIKTSPTYEGTPGNKLLFGFAYWMMSVGSIYIGFGVPALLLAFVRDPSLGIRTVGRRLGLSHVLVVVIPLLLVSAVWMVTTVLGVNNDRAMVAGRSLTAEGVELRRELVDVLAARGDAREAAARVAAHGAGGGRSRLWRVEHGRFERLTGDSIAGEHALVSWTDSLAGLPLFGFVRFGDSLWFGAAARDLADSTRAAIVLQPADSILAGDASRVAGAKLTVFTGTSGGSNGSLVIGPGADGIRTERLIAADSTLRLASEKKGRMSAEDSLQIEEVRKVTRQLGLASRRARARRPGGVTITTPRDTFDVVKASPGTMVLAGKTLVPGIAWDDSARSWVSMRSMMIAQVPARSALVGLYEGVRENPITWIPIVLILSVTVLALLVAAFDFAMVRGMAGSITAAIDALKGGAARLEAGQLDQRIEVRGDDDLWSVAGTFNRAMVGLERARVLEAERTRIESELATARRIQARLLPGGPPRVTGFEIAGLSESAREVGGDYFDHIPIGDHAVLLVIADVSGKGVPAALLMSDFRASLIHRDLARRDPVALATQLNDAVLRSVETGKFVTAFLAFADARDGRLDYVSAGHNPAVLRRGDGTHELLNEGGLPFGVMPDARYASGRSEFRPGDLLALYTDGVTEGADAAGQLWGEERLLDTLGREHDVPCDRLARLIAERVRAFEGESGPADDITLLLARRVPFC